MTPIRRTHYTEEYVKDLIDKFLDKFATDEKPFGEKLRNMYMSRGTYSQIKNKRFVHRKRVLELMRSYLEGRTPKHKTLTDAQGYCCECETVFTKEEMKDEWTCRKCKNQSKYISGLVTGKLSRYYAMRSMMRKSHGEARAKYLAQRRAAFLRRNYGELARCVELIRTLSEEIRNEEV